MSQITCNQRPRTIVTSGEGHEASRRSTMRAIVEGHHHAFVRSAPSFALQLRSSASSDAMSTLLEERLEDDRGPAGKRCSSISFLLVPRPDVGTLEAHCAVLVHDREIKEAHYVTSLDGEAMGEFRDFVERQYRDFADRYFAAERVLEAMAAEPSVVSVGS